jgi:hypothetical protein
MGKETAIKRAVNADWRESTYQDSRALALLITA